MKIHIHAVSGELIPEYGSAYSAGADLKAAVEETVRLAPGERKLIPTGVRMELPEGFEAQVRPRSGLALKHGVTVLNAPGTVDSDYRGEIGVILINHGETFFEIERGDRIAQLVISPVTTVDFVPILELNETARGAGGFGSTGR
ncbi:MAG: dUTP diphosphatase [Spirochaetia bacterium]